MRKPLWTSEDAAKATGGRAEGRWSIYGLSIDTRSIQPGDMFVALKDVRDGHDFVPNAYEAGAGACLVSRPIEDVPALEVEDTLEALEAMGEAARARTDAFCCAITGSVGKTSVKEMLAQIFRAFGPAHWSVKSFNNHWGVPLTLARMPQDTTRAVFEIGMNTPGEIEPRSNMVRPHAALITKIAPAHLEGMGSEAAVALEKSAIFAGLEPGGYALLPLGDTFYEFLRGKVAEYAPDAKILTFGSPNSHAYVTGYDTDGVSSRFNLNVLGEAVEVSVDAVGTHWGQNVAAALLMSNCSGLGVAEAAAALNGYAPPEGRGNAEWLSLTDGIRALMVDDAYNANPESMRAALAGFAMRPATRKLIALGEMKELGPDADALHAGLASDIMACEPAHVFLSGDGIKPLAAALEGQVSVSWAQKSSELHEMVNKSLISGDALLIKGSNASGMRTLAEALRRFSAEINATAERAGEE